MKSIIAAATISCAYGFVAKSPLKMAQESMFQKNVLSSTESASTSIDLPYSFTESISFYQYNQNTDTLSTDSSLSIKIDLDANQNKEKIDMTVSYSGTSYEILEVIDFENLVAYVSYPAYNYCETFDFSDEISSFSLTDYIDAINDGETLSYLGEKSAFWSSDDTYDVYLLTDELAGSQEELYVNLDTNEVEYVAYNYGYLGEFTVSPTETTFDSDYFDITCN